MTLLIHIVDDEAEVRESLGLLLETLDYEVELYPSGEVFLSALPRTKSGIILLDIRMPGRDGIEVLKALRDQSNTMPVIMMSGHGDIPLTVRAMQEGATDFIEKPFEADRILSAIEQAIGQQTPDTNLEKLTARERETAQYLSQGLPNKQIAHELGISVRTVEAHRARIMSKLDISSSAELVRLMLSK